MDKENELADKDKQKRDPEQVQIDNKSDTFGLDEQKTLVDMLKKQLESDIVSMNDWIEQRAKDIEMYEGAPPSVIESLDKESWMSDRNMGLVASNCDAYQATLMATCYNTESLHFTATAENDVDHKDDLEKFTKWGLSSKEANFAPQVDDFIHNKITQGISYFHTRWDVTYKWVDRRIPKHDDEGNFIKYDIETERVRFEKGVIENISDVSDLIFPEHGNTLQEKHHLIHRIKMSARDIVDYGKNGQFVNIDAEYIKKLKEHCFNNRLTLLGDKKSEALGIKSGDSMTDNDLSIFPIEVFNWYGTIKKENGNEEEYRITFEPKTMKFLAGKPLRKINRACKRPFVGQPLIRRPGRVHGKSLPKLIGDISNAFNNIFNQKSDFQFVENCPTGFYNPDEAFQGENRKLIPGMMHPTADPNSVNFPNFQRSMAWAQIDFQVLLEVLERATGAAAYFMSNSKGVSGTATRDTIINEKSETRFGMWVLRIIQDITEAIMMWIEMYQDWAPPTLGDRILGEDGKKLFKNFSIETIMGGYDAIIEPDIISGSKSLEREIAKGTYDLLSVSPWMSPMMNPKGSWKLTVDTIKKLGLLNVEQYMPPQPAAQFVDTKYVKDKWAELKQGQMPQIEQGEDVMELYMGMTELSETKRNELDPEYLPNLDLFIFKLNVAMMKQMQQMMNEAQANKMAMGMIQDVESGKLDQKDLANA